MNASFKFFSGNVARDGYLVYRANERRSPAFRGGDIERTTFRVELPDRTIEVEVAKYDDAMPADVTWPIFVATEAVELRALHALLGFAIYEKDRLDNPRPLLDWQTKATLDGTPVTIIRHDGGSKVTVETPHVIDHDDDGDDEDGRPIMRPIYERRTVPYDSLELLAVSTG